MDEPECKNCGEKFNPKRAALGYQVCLQCGDKTAKETRAGWTISLAGHKQGYTLITNKEQLKEVNKYANT